MVMLFAIDFFGMESSPCTALPPGATWRISTSKTPLVAVTQAQYNKKMKRKQGCHAAISSIIHHPDHWFSVPFRCLQ